MAFTNQFDTTGGGVPGMGDAFITTPISNIDPIAQIIQQGEQRRQQREKERQEQLKQQEDLFKGINLGSDKYWVDKDAEYFHGPEGAVPKLLEEVKKAYVAGKGKLNPMDYAKFQQSISKLQADAAQSLKDRDVYTKSIETFRNPKSGYDVDESVKQADAGFAGAGLGKRDVNALTGVAAKQDFGVKNQKFIKMFNDDIEKAGYRLFQPDVNLEEVKTAITQQRGQAVEALAKAYQIDNPEATPEEAMAAVQKFVTNPFVQKKDNSITPYQNASLGLKGSAQAETKRHNLATEEKQQQKLAQDWQKQVEKTRQWSATHNDPDRQKIVTRQTLEAALNGDEGAIAWIKGNGVLNANGEMAADEKSGKTSPVYSKIVDFKPNLTFDELKTLPRAQMDKWDELQGIVSKNPNTKFTAVKYKKADGTIGYHVTADNSEKGDKMLDVLADGLVGSGLNAGQTIYKNVPKGANTTFGTINTPGSGTSTGNSKTNTNGSGNKTKAPAMTPAEWKAKWATLKSGEKLVGLDGKTYIKK